MSHISGSRPQAAEKAQENRSWCDERASARRFYAYVGNDPLNATDPSGLWQFTLSGGLGFGGVITFGYNSGQWNAGAYVGAVQGLNATLNTYNGQTTTPGVYTNVVASAGAELGRVGVDVGANLQASTPAGRLSQYGTAEFEANANFGPYSAGGKVTVGPNGTVTDANGQVLFGAGASAYLAGVSPTNHPCSLRRKPRQPLLSPQRRQLVRQAWSAPVALADNRP